MFLKAMYTFSGGSKTTTITNALSDLYNITSVQSNQITGKLKKIVVYVYSPTETIFFQS
jgi:predicted transcriptional regulator